MLAWVRNEMRSFAAPWFVAGGWALDLFIGAQHRSHSDVDIAIFREDQVHLASTFPGWHFEKAENRTLKPWNPDEFLALPVHEVHASAGAMKLESC